MSRVKFHYRRILHAKDGSRTTAAVAKKYSKLLRDIETMTAQFLFGPGDSGSTNLLRITIQRMMMTVFTQMVMMMTMMQMRMRMKQMLDI
jgi:hypothetical protein